MLVLLSNLDVSWRQSLVQILDHRSREQRCNYEEGKDKPEGGSGGSVPGKTCGIVDGEKHEDCNGGSLQLKFSSREHALA